MRVRGAAPGYENGISLAILCPWVPPERSAITQYVLQAAAHLERLARVHVVWIGAEPADVPGGAGTWTVRRTGLAALSGVLAALAAIRPDRVVMQYSPYLWARSGFDVAGPALALALFARGMAPDLVWHELWVPWMARPAGFGRGCFQRAMAALLARVARRSIVTSFERVDELASVSRARGRRFALVPMTSLVSVVPCERTRVRDALGVRAGEVLLGVFGFDHDSRPTQGMRAVRRALEAAGLASRLLVIGTARVDEPGWAIHAGYVPAEEASRLLGALDVFLAPFVDGVSTRRTSTAAAFAHGVAVVTTVGPHTDRALFVDGLVELAPVNDDAAFAQAVVKVAGEVSRRSELARNGQEMFEGYLCWAAHVGALWAVLGGTGNSNGQRAVWAGGARCA